MRMADIQAGSHDVALGNEVDELASQRQSLWRGKESREGRGGRKGGEEGSRT